MFPDLDFDPDELVQYVRAVLRVPCGPPDRDRAFALSERFVLSPEIRQGETALRVERRIVGSGFKQGLVGLSRLLRVCSGARGVASETPCLGLRDRPGGGIVVKRRRREPAQPLALLAVKDPHEIVVVGEVRDQDVRLDRLSVAGERGASAREVSLAEMCHGHTFDGTQVRRNEAENACKLLSGLPDPVEAQEEVAEDFARSAGVQTYRLSQMLERLVPSREADLREREPAKEIRAARREPQGLLVLR